MNLNLAELDTYALRNELRRIAEVFPMEDLNRSEIMAMIYVMQSIIDRINDVVDRNPAPVLTLRHGKRSTAAR